MKYVPGHGPNSAKLLVCGEAPGKDEEAAGKNFIGATGKIVRRLLSECGCDPESVYWTNVCKVRPPDNNIKLLHRLGVKLEDFIPQLWDEINSLRPNCILAFGNTALTALTGITVRGKKGEESGGIKLYRGSILQSCYASHKVVPTIHPASLLHGQSDGAMQDWKAITYIKWDIQRAINQSKFPELLLPQRNLIVCRSNLDLYRFFNRNEDRNKVAVDIETFRTIPICISFAYDSNEAISVPLFNNLGAHEEIGMTRSDLVQCWRDITEILYDPKIQKIGQNFKFDARLLREALNDTYRVGLNVRGFYFDNLLAFRTLYPELPGSLAFQTSVLTEEPYYKEEGKGYNPKKDKVERLLLYNAKDAAISYECYERELEELRARNLEHFFFTRVMPLHPFYFRLEGRGIKRDASVKESLNEKYKNLQTERQVELNDLTREYGVENLNVNSNGMNGQVGKLLFLHMSLPIRKGTDEKTLDALRRNVLKGNSPDMGRKRRILEIILEIRKIRKTRSTYIDSECHADSKLRTSVRIALESGRTSTGILQQPVTTRKMGLAFQTITKHGDVGSDLREMLIPDENYIFIEPDLSQAEARVVAVLARDEKLLKMFTFGVDIHSVTKAWIDGKSIPLLDAFFLVQCEVEAARLAKELNAALRVFTTDEQRQQGKKFRHAGHYDMGKHEASIQVGIPELVAGRILQVFHKTNPNIKQVFHREVQEFLAKNNRTLKSPHGRVRQFLNKWGDELFKEAYAQIPQATVSDQVKFAMIRIEQRAPWLEILEESHDSFLSQCPLMVGSREPFSLVDKTYEVVKEELETPIDFSACSLGSGLLTIPCSISIGKTNWLDMEKIM